MSGHLNGGRLMRFLPIRHNVNSTISVNASGVPKAVIATSHARAESADSLMALENHGKREQQFIILASSRVDLYSGHSITIAPMAVDIVQTSQRSKSDRGICRRHYDRTDNRPFPQTINAEIHRVWPMRPASWMI